MKPSREWIHVLKRGSCGSDGQKFVVWRGCKSKTCVSVMAFLRQTGDDPEYVNRKRVRGERNESQPGNGALRIVNIIDTQGPEVFAELSPGFILRRWAFVHMTLRAVNVALLVTLFPHFPLTPASAERDTHQDSPAPLRVTLTASDVRSQHAVRRRVRSAPAPRA